MNILAIGNSFSQDAFKYLHNIAKCDDFQLTTVNLYIGGCSLSKHYKNMLADAKEYIMEFNGDFTGFKVSLKEALLNRDWDFISFQQASNHSPYYETYQPYLDELAAYVRKFAPKAKFVIHQTWAYENGSARLCEGLGYTDHREMFADIKEAYTKAASDIHADLVIPSGEVFQNLLTSGIEKVHRDTFHASIGVGRYALALTWYAMISGADITENSYSGFDEEITHEEIKTIKKCVMETVKKYI